MQGHITKVEGTDLRHFCDMLDVPQDKRPRTLRFWQAADATAVKVKVNGGMWTPAFGAKDEEF